MVLCVDDNAELADILFEVLQAKKFDPRTAPGGKECLASLRDGDIKPDIILLDIMMEPMDGWMTLRNIRDDPDLFDIPVVMLTGKYPTLSEVTDYGSLIDGYLMKPFAIESLTCEIWAVLDRVKERELFIERARSEGIEEKLLDEYRELSSTVHILRQLEGIIKNGAFNHESVAQAEKKLHCLETRLNELLDPGS